MRSSARLAALAAALVTSACAAGGGAAPNTPGTIGSAIRFGAVLTLSGPTGALGQQQLVGAQVAIEELNKGKGILGRKVELLPAQDDALDPSKAAAAMRLLGEALNVDFIIGPTTSGGAGAVAPLSSSDKKPIATTGILSDLGTASKYPYVFRIAPSQALYGQTFVAYLKSAGLKKPGLIAANLASGTASADSVKQAASGVTIADTQFFESGAVDMTPQMTRLKNSGADSVILLSSAAPDEIGVLKARRALGWSVPVLGFATLADPSIAGAIGADGMAQVFAGQQWKNVTTNGAPPATKQVLEQLRNKLGQHPLTQDPAQSLAAYDGVMMFANAAERAGSIDPDKVKAYLETHAYRGAKATYQYDATRHDGDTIDSLVFVVATSFKDGLYTPAPGQ